MRVGIATVYTPAIRGGAEYLVDGLIEAVRAAGHSVHKISVPFSFEPPDVASRTMDQCLGVDFGRFGGGQIDKMICLKFPAYLIDHPDKCLWLLHQHRAAYDLFDTPHGWQPGRRDTDALRARIIEADGKAIGAAKAVYTIAARVSERLLQHNGIVSKPLYHPPPNVSDFNCKDALPYIFVPSRLEKLKRQDLMLHALAACKTPVQAIFSGTGGMLPQLQALAGKLGLSDRVRFVGNVSRAEMLALYANCTGVFFGPFDEDYGYISLEAMLSSKPVLTCHDSGGPLEFVVDGETGFVTSPEPEAIGEGLDRLTGDLALARRLGQNGRSRYEAMNISWHHVVETLLSDGNQTQVNAA